jgi:UDP:flavonoid glycosyltransferase YjiC (YdhE family)
MTASGSPRGTPAHFLFAMFQGGGNIPLILPVAAQLVARGHDVRVLAGPGIRAARLPVSGRFRERIAAAGAAFVPFQEPDPHPFDVARPPRGLAFGWTPRWLVGSTSNVQSLIWSPAWADNVIAELGREPTDVLVVDHFLLGAVAAGEAAGVPTGVLVHGFYKHRPAAGLPAYASGQMPDRSLVGRLRDLLYNAAVTRIYRRDGLPALNRARRRLGLPVLRSPFDQYDRAARVLILASAALDFPVRRLEPNVRYAGTPFDDAGAAAWTPPWSAGDARPTVLVSLSTLAQGQAPVLQQILTALASLPVRALVTLGPSLDASQFTAPPNVIFETFVPHAAVLPQVTAMVTQCGLGTMMKALAHGIPLVCIPILGDQPDNAARVVARGAGVRLARDASPEQIRTAIRRVLDVPSFRENAQRLAATIAAEDGARTAADELEALVRDPSRSDDNADL